MSRSGTSLAEVLESVRPGVWGSDVATEKRPIPVRVVRNGDISENRRILDDNIPRRWVSEKELWNSRVTDRDTLLVCSGYIGKSARLGDLRFEEPVIASNFIRIVSPDSQTDPSWLFWLLGSVSAINYMQRVSAGTSLQNLPTSFFKEWKIPYYPSLAKQRHIASVLDSVEKSIGQTEHVVAKTEQLRDALLHELLTRGVPEYHEEWIEVPDKARPPPPWKVVKLGDIAEVQKGSSFTSKELVPGDIPVIAGGREPAYYHRYSNRPSNTITISASGAASGYVSCRREPIFATDCTTVFSKSELSITNYIYYFLKHSQRKIYRLRTGSALPHLYPRDIARFKVMLPPLEEQILICKYLDIISEVIDQNRQVINIQSKLRDALLHELLIIGLPDNHND